MSVIQDVWGILMSLRISVLCLALSFLLLPVCAQSTASYDSLVQEGNRQLQAGNLTDALATGNRAIALDRGRWQAYALSGGALMNLKRYEEAADSLSKAIDRAPEAKQPALRDLRKQCALSEAGVAVATSSSSPSSPLQAAPNTTQAEAVLWKSIEKSRDQRDYEAYLSQYPNGAFGVLAHEHLNQLQTEEKAFQEERAAQATEEKRLQVIESERLKIAGLSVNVNSWNGTWGRYVLAPGASLTINASGAKYTGEGNPPHNAFLIPCSDLAWHTAKSFGESLVVFQAKSTNKTYRLGPYSDRISEALKMYCGI
jgi:tetratricopeptide (TPR) repeat protein